MRRRQLAIAQGVFREHMRDEGYVRLQTWLPQEAASALKVLCKGMNLSQAQVLASALRKLDQERDVDAIT